MGSIPILMFIQHLSLTPMKLRMPLDNPKKTFTENVSAPGTQNQWHPAGVLSPPAGALSSFLHFSEKHQLLADAFPLAGVRSPLF